MLYVQYWGNIVKLLLTGDWHLRWRNPVYRTDDYFKTQSGKIEQILELADKEGCNYISQPGDFFDSYDASAFVIQHYINLLRKYSIPILCVRGQHDLRYHSKNIENTALAIMEAAEVVEVISCDHSKTVSGIVNLVGDREDFQSAEHIRFCGCSWNDEIPEIEEDAVVGLNVLIMHKMIINDEKLWEGQQEYARSMHLLRRYNFDLFVCGDNHISFSVLDYQGKGRHLINCGSLMRSAINQVEHKPVTYVYDTADKSIEPHYLKIQPAKKVFNTETVKQREERNERLEEFVGALGEERELGLNFLDNLRSMMKKDIVDDETRSVLEEAING